MFAVFADQACTATIYTHKFNIACMQKGCYSAKIKSAKTFLTVNLRRFILSKYTHYTVHTCTAVLQFQIHVHVDASKL